ncbi:hypothetical protein CDL12_15285 [Handroanthus impetiginosus]|uniref:Transcription factor, Myb superfamily n=1 Tax=Handroanthus impetiginosus TaxID=429701 RepID=A0A2G9H3M6_9LAMI|nr:hypothetical protein CDL12_15285 [Handroanthus impetiginosus]
MEGLRDTMESNIPKGVRKGAWTKEEDILLRNCIDKYGEGKWHLVPLRAGLNRCRKSCRLRWLNYLRPTNKRGHFTTDEVDLIIRLHKLQGNRWPLIAGRIPGRTANDVKNFWNTHIQKKIIKKTTFSTYRNIIRPQPHFPALHRLRERFITDHQQNSEEKQENKEPPSSSGEEVDECIRWWTKLLQTTDENIGDCANLRSIC